MDSRLVLRTVLEEGQRYQSQALDGLSREEAAWMPSDSCNSMAFILWHLAREEDHCVNAVVRGVSELYEAAGWRARLGTPAAENGEGYAKPQLLEWPTPDLSVLREYAQAVRDSTYSLLASLDPERLADRITFRRWELTVEEFLAALAAELVLHVGQIAYLRGMLRGLGG